MFLCNVSCYVIFPLMIQQKSLCCISSRLHLPQHPAFIGGQQWLLREFSSCSTSWQAAVLGLSVLDVPVGALC